MPIHQESGASKWLRAHYNEVAKKYPNEWVAIDDKKGLVDHDADPAKLGERTRKMGKSLLFAHILPPGAIIG